MGRSLSAIAISSSINPDPGSSSIMMIKVSPIVPFSMFSLTPFPHIPDFSWTLIHIIHVITIIKCGKFRIFTKITLTKLIAYLITANIISSNRYSHFKYTTSPSIVKTTIGLVEGSVLNCNLMQRSINCFRFVNAKKWK